MKKTILISCVNYNSEEVLLEYLDSIEIAFKECPDGLDLSVIVGDNSEHFNALYTSVYSYNLNHVNNNGNLGYIGGITAALENSEMQPTDFDFFIISNVDVKLDSEFFQRILHSKFSNEIGWLAPAILSEKEDKDRNPKIISRPSRKKMLLTRLMYQFPIIDTLYVSLLYSKRRASITENKTYKDIYAGHGSFMIFTANYLKHKLPFTYEPFLFGEEIFYAELLSNLSLKVRYVPELVVYDKDHISTSKMKSKSYYQFNYKAIDFLIKKFFNE